MRSRAWLLGVGAAVAILGVAGCGAIDETGLVGLEDCTNGVDDNGDGFADCEDSQCSGHAYCMPYRELNCGNAADDDGDGLTDCADPDCQQNQRCNPEYELACADGEDNDGDGLTDCADPDCKQTDACREKCDDGVDNDGDGQVDCADDQCWDSPVCQIEDCANGEDDDGDGAIDCADEDCATNPGCALVERCDDGVDNDTDGLTDCADPDCATNPWCHETQCADSEDNDGDGLVDCDDPSCAGLHGCISNTTCQPAQTIFCNYLLEGTTTGRLNNIDTYGCVGGNYPGGEQYYHLGAFPGTQVTVWFTDFTGGQNLQMVVVPSEDSNPGCNPSGDCDVPTTSGGSDQTISLAPDAYVDLYIVVDSSGTGGGDFDLYVTCEPLVEENCQDTADNDNDGLVDCADPDCWFAANCSVPIELCGDGMDNDGDTLVDCADPDCFGDSHCLNAETLCYDGVDNDGDGATDCADPDCWLDQSCSGGETSCTNGLDDDGDGDTDCWDFDCAVGGACDWWFDHDVSCWDFMDCGPPDHFCVMVGGSLPGFCSRTCSTPGTLGADCDTGTNIQGFCVPDSNGTGNLCILPCGAAHPGSICPAGWACVAPDPTFPAQGVCRP